MWPPAPRSPLEMAPRGTSLDLARFGCGHAAEAPIRRASCEVPRTREAGGPMQRLAEARKMTRDLADMTDAALAHCAAARISALFRKIVPGVMRTMASFTAAHLDAKII